MWNRPVLISGIKGDPAIELSPNSSFDLTNSFCTLSRHRFIRRNCALRESVESKERISGSGRLKVLVIGVDRLMVVPGGLERRPGEGYGSSSLGHRGIGGHPSQARGSSYAFGEFRCWGIACCAS
ncbi:hypothetical protein BHM03_00014415 [Ensete ventricosum]|nr:hypothetical protein BHM03_00014415 [Ensete ventricosum]